MTTWKNTDEIEILQSVTRFYSKRLKIAENAVIPTVIPLSTVEFPPGGDFWVTLSVGDGQFPFDEQDDEQIRQDLLLTVMGYTRMQSDWGGRDSAFLLDRNRGAFGIRNKLLLIVGAQLFDREGVALTASRIYAVGSVAPNYDKDKAIGWTGIRVGVEFDLKVIEAEDLGDD